MIGEVWGLVLAFGRSPRLALGILGYPRLLCIGMIKRCSETSVES